MGKENSWLSIVAWLIQHWKEACAFIYTMVCVFDFVIFPAWVGITRLPIDEFLTITASVDDKDTLDTLIAWTYRQYQPYTLQGGSMLHLAMGALLSSTVLTRHLNRPKANWPEKDVE